jgi:hypothetical protein
MTANLAAETRRLRTEEGLSTREIQQRLALTKTQLREWLRGVPPPEWTRRPNAKDQQRERARQLRHDGWSVPEIAVEIGVARSTAFRWTQDIPLDSDSERAQLRRERSKRMTDARWGKFRQERDQRQADVHAAAQATIGSLSDRDLLLLGAAIYWSEGSKSKPWRRSDKVVLVNSDPALLAVFLRFLESIGIDRSAIWYRLSIHESADAEAAVTWWSETLGLPPDRFQTTTLKRHVPRTNRRNTGDEYHGCLVLSVPKSREVYWLLEGAVKETARAAMRDCLSHAR